MYGLKTLSKMRCQSCSARCHNVLRRNAPLTAPVRLASNLLRQSAFCVHNMRCICAKFLSQFNLLFIYSSFCPKLSIGKDKFIDRGLVKLCTVSRCSRWHVVLTFHNEIINEVLVQMRRVLAVTVFFFACI